MHPMEAFRTDLVEGAFGSWEEVAAEAWLLDLFNMEGKDRGTLAVWTTPNLFIDPTGHLLLGGRVLELLLRASREARRGRTESPAPLGRHSQGAGPLVRPHRRPPAR